MDVCEHCGARLPLIEAAQLVCSCAGARQEETLTKARRAQWSRQRTELVDLQKELRRKNRRMRIRSEIQNQ